MNEVCPRCGRLECTPLCIAFRQWRESEARAAAALADANARSEEYKREWESACERGRAAEHLRAGAAAQLNVMWRLVSFLVSVIKSGEPWTETCQAMLDAARTPDDGGAV